MSPDISARNRCDQTMNRRRSTLSATAPPTIGNTNTGTSSQRPSRPTASVDSVRSYTTKGTATATISSPSSEIDRPMKSRRKSSEVRNGVTSTRCERTRDISPRVTCGSGSGRR